MKFDCNLIQRSSLVLTRIHLDFRHSLLIIYGIYPYLIFSNSVDKLLKIYCNISVVTNNTPSDVIHSFSSEAFPLQCQLKNERR